MHRVILAGLVCVVGCLCNATGQFADNFEGDLSRWTGQGYGTHHGIIVADPLRAGNHVLSFTGTRFGGDMFSMPAVTLVEGQEYALSLEYLGRPVFNSAPDNYGGFAGLSDIVLSDPYAMPYWTNPWYLGSQVDYPGLGVHLLDDGQWHSYSINFVWSKAATGAHYDTIHIALEDYYDPLNAQVNNSVGDVFFDNVQLVAVPEPACLSYVWAGMVGVAWRLRRRSSSGA